MGWAVCGALIFAAGGSAAHRVAAARGGVARAATGAVAAPSATARRSLTAELWRLHQPEAEATLRDPFLTELADGSLPPAAFDFYIRQDDLYLTAYARAMSAASARTAREDMAGFVFLATEALSALGEHDPFSNQTAGGARLTAVNAAYSDLLLGAASSASTVGVGLIAAVPCARLYAWIGTQLEAAGAARHGNPYASWIQAYAAPKYQRWADQFEAVVDNYTAGLTAAELRDATRFYSTAMTYEREFFASALSRGGGGAVPATAAAVRAVVPVVEQSAAVWLLDNRVGALYAGLGFLLLLPVSIALAVRLAGPACRRRRARRRQPRCADWARGASYGACAAELLPASV
eukprot:TRINITY_DN36408_c0_g1_i1.p1 TRINITY_DN36408_c0_g1~~TRINITY_DN36408_c0_g1_i1.p1  ORF type:complete len:349 (+),score=85.41 TRINITY_DN36408_c0_g1_i1:73-1119(+)